jgi:hypothetical protein
VAAPTYLSSGAVIADTATPYSCAPAVVAHAVNDLLLSPCITSGAQAHTLAGTGWAQIGSSIVGTHRISFAWKRATATTGEGPTWTASGGTGTMFSNVHIVQGAETSGTPWDSATTFGDATTNDNTPDAPAITTLAADRLVLAFFFGIANGTPTASAGWSVTDSSSSATAPTCRTFIGWRTQATPATIAASQVATLTGSYIWGGVALPVFSPGGAFVPGRPKRSRSSIGPSLPVPSGMFN